NVSFMRVKTPPKNDVAIAIGDYRGDSQTIAYGIHVADELIIHVRHCHNTTRTHCPDFRFSALRARKAFYQIIGVKKRRGSDECREEEKDEFPMLFVIVLIKFVLIHI